MRTAALLPLLTLALWTPCWAQPPTQFFAWEEAPALPGTPPGQFLGSHHGALIATDDAGNVYVLEDPASEWDARATLDTPRVFGAAASTQSGVVLAGGRESGGSQAFSTQVSLLSFENGQIVQQALPDLPQPWAYMGAAALGDTVYVAGGQAPDDTGRARFARLQLGTGASQWEELDPVPGPGRMSPVVAAQNGAVYVFGGLTLPQDAGGEGEQRPLSDAYRYTPGAGWEPVAQLPRPLADAAGTAFGQSHIFWFGAPGPLQGQPPGDSPAASAGGEVWAYHTITDTWSDRGTVPGAGPQARAALWRGAVIFMGGSAAWWGEPIAATREFGLLNIVIMILYFAGLVWMGLYFSRREHNTDDFFLGGRRVPWWAIGLSIFGTQLSAITYLAIPARAYMTDWVYVWANVGILIIAPVVVYYVLPRYRKGQYTTAYEYLEERFNVAARLYGACVFFLFQMGRVGIVLFLPAMALNAVTGLNVYVCILAMGVLSTLYTALGGIEAVIWTDVIQVVVLSAGILISLFIVITQLDGGAGELFNVAAEAGKFHAVNWTWDITTTALWVCVIGNVFAVAYPYSADQTVVQRYLASASEKDAARAIWTNAVLSIPATIVFFLMGTALYVFFRARPELLDPTLSNDAIFPLFIVRQLPPGISGLVIAAIFAAAMSSLDSSMNSVSAVVVNDFYLRFRPALSEAGGLRLARAVTCVFGLLGTGVALLMAAQDIQSIFEQYNRILGLTGGGLAGLLALGIFTRRANGQGALAGAFTSAAAVYLVQTYTHVHLFLYAAVGFLTSFAVGYVASFLFPAPSKQA